MDTYTHIGPKEEIVNARLHALESTSVWGEKLLLALAVFVTLLAVATSCVLFSLASQGKTDRTSVCR